MSWLARLWRLFSPAQSNDTEAKRCVPDFPEGFGPLGAVGESHYQVALQRIAKSGRVCWATLVPEPDNPFDALAVMVRIDGETVGYLERRDARRYQKRLLLLPTPIEVPAKLIGGTSDKPSFGVLLDCRGVEALPTPKRTRQPSAPAIDPTDQPF
jgi:hypothetical protein